MKQKIAIVGAGGLGKEVLTILHSLDTVEIIGFFDEGVPVNTLVGGLPVLGDLNTLNAWDELIQIVIAIGAPQVKARVFEKIKNNKIAYATLIHPSAILGDSSTIKIGEGTIIASGANLTVDIEIGKHVLINLNTTIGHDTTIGDFTSIMPGVNLAGGVKLGKRVLVGSGANVINRVMIGDDVTVGSGAVVIRDVPASKTVVGVPAKMIE